MVKPAMRSAVLLDAQPLWLDALARILERVGVETVARAVSAAEALDAIATRRPDLFILDTAFADATADGLTCLRSARAQSPELVAIAISASEDQSAVVEAFDAGAYAYVLKRASAADLATAIRQSVDVSIHLRPAVWTPVPAPSDDDRGLSRREREILSLVANGYTNAQLARMLWVTEQTVKFHLTNVYRKLGVSNRNQAGWWARKNGLAATSVALGAEASAATAV